MLNELRSQNRYALSLAFTLYSSSSFISAAGTSSHPLFTCATLSADNLDVIWLDKQDMIIKFHVCGRTLQKWRTAGILPFSKVFGKIFYNQSDVQHFLLQQRQGRKELNGMNNE